MSINFCTLTGSTLNTFCGNRRQIIVDRLLEEKYPPVPAFLGTNNSSVSIDFAKRYPHLVRHVEADEETPVLRFEQPFVTVTAELLGDQGTHQLEVEPHLHFVMVTDFRLVSVAPKQDEVVVNISDFEVR